MRVFTCIFSLKGKTPTLQNQYIKFSFSRERPYYRSPQLEYMRPTHKYPTRVGDHNLSGMTGVHPCRYIGSNPIICTNKGVTYELFRFHNTIVY